MTTRKSPPIPAAEIKAKLLKVFKGSTWHLAASSILPRLAERAPRHWADHLNLEHAPVGSPSGALKCQRQSWYIVNDYPRDHQPPEWWNYRATIGTLQELIWLAALEIADERLYCEQFESPLIREPFRGTPDAMLPRVGTLAEFKSINMTGFRMIEQRGLYHAKEEHYAQAQAYMYLADVDWLLYIASVADPSLRRGDSWFLVDWIPFDTEYADWLIHTTRTKSATVLNSRTVPPRDFEPIARPKLTKGGKPQMTREGEIKYESNWPCGSDETPYCPFRATCLKDG